MDEPKPTRMQDEIHQALRIAAWAKANGLLGPDGEPRKIIGTLPVTADGAIVGDGAVTYWYNKWLGFVVERQTDLDHGFSMNFSTREAAEAAAKGGSDA